MRQRHPHTHCLNCYTSLDKGERFCPNCGQENTHYRVSAWTLFRELIETLFNFDSRFAHSIRPFLFQPGVLTQAFIDGRRVHYVHPLRFYFITTLIYFFSFNMFIGYSGLFQDDEDDDNLKVQKEISLQLPVGSDSVAQVAEVQAAEFKKQMKKARRQVEKAKSYMDSATYAQVLQGLDTAQSNASIEDLKEAYADVLEKPQKQDTNRIEFFGTKYWYTGNNLSLLLKQDSLTPHALLDSLHASEYTTLNLRMARQAIRLANSEQEEIAAAVMDGIPTMMFVLLPLFAFMLKIIYIRSDRFFIDHLIFSIHSHTYVFFIMILLVFADGEVLLGEYGDSVQALLLLLPLWYFYMMLKRIYRQGWFKTGLKMLIIGTLYSTVISIAVVIEIFLSVLLM